MKIFNKPRCTEIKSKNNLRTQLGLLSKTTIIQTHTNISAK